MREDGKPLRTSGWKQWTPEDIKVQNYCDMKRTFESHAMDWTYERTQLLKRISVQLDEIEALKEQRRKRNEDEFFNAR